MAKKKSGQDLKTNASSQIAAPKLDYAPAKTRRYNPPIGLIGCGGISEVHLRAYKAAGYNVVALCDLLPDRAENRRKEFFPDAQTYTDYREFLKRDDIEVVDIATHPQDREYLIPAALNARKNVLSQKPFVLDLDKGHRFSDLADKNGVKLAVNQNGRWAPYFSYMRQAVNKGLIGDVYAVHLACHWDHEWIKNSHFNNVHHIVLYDFAIHWFDILACFMGNRPAKRVFASLQHAAGQQAKPPLLGQAMVEFEGGQASLVFDAVTHYGPGETNFLIGTKGTLKSDGPVCAATTVTLSTKKGIAQADVSKGNWFPTGFHGSMGELLSAIEQKREPGNNSRDNLRGLAICFAAVASAESGKPVEVGKAKRVPIERCSVAAAKPDSGKAA
jgi:predicted dehydrogenase